MTDLRSLAVLREETHAQKAKRLKIRAQQIDAADNCLPGFGTVYRRSNGEGLTENYWEATDGKISPSTWNKWMKNAQPGNGQSIPESLLKIDKSITTQEAVKMLNEIEKYGYRP